MRFKFFLQWVDSYAVVMDMELDGRPGDFAAAGVDESGQPEGLKEKQHQGVPDGRCPPPIRRR